MVVDSIVADAVNGRRGSLQPQNGAYTARTDERARKETLGVWLALADYFDRNSHVAGISGYAQC